MLGGSASHIIYRKYFDPNTGITDQQVDVQQAINEAEVEAEVKTQTKA
jgi:hypothetical protein